MFIGVHCGFSPFQSSDFAGVRVLRCDNGMNVLSNHELLRRYATTGEEAPFTELVRRHLNLVWGAARRTTRNGDSARDVAQVVFVDLARKARHLSLGTVLEGWLYRAACHAATKHVRTETRRTQRERLAMQDPSLAEVGRRLGTSEDTAQKRVARALERVRAALESRGIPLGGGALEAALTVAGTQAAPAGMAKGISAAALAAAAAGGWGTVTVITAMKSKLVLGIVGAGAVVAALVLQQREVARLQVESAALRGQAATLRSTAGSQKTSLVEGQDSELTRLRAEHVELLRLRGEVARLRSVADSALANRLQQAEARANQAESAVAQIHAMEQARQHSAAIINAMKNMGLAARIYGNDHKGAFPKTFEEMRSELPLNADGNFSGGVSTDQFEFFTHDRLITLEEPELILFQEKSPRHLPDGTWERIYCLVDGSVQTVPGTQPDFSEFERGRKGTTANTPKKP